MDTTHEIKGTNFRFTTAKQGNQDLELWIRNLLHPKVNFEIFELAIKVKKLFYFVFHQQKESLHTSKRKRI
jgi:hypothetical protein